MTYTWDQLFTALSKAQKEFKPAPKDAANPFFKSSYADLESVVDAVRDALAKHDLCFVQKTKMTEVGMCLETILGHKSGQFISGEYLIKPIKEDPQGVGSAITYAKRYALSAMLGVVTSDDDGEAAMGRGNGQTESKQPVQKAPAAKKPAPPQENQNSDIPVCCGSKMMKSKYHENTWYCGKCKGSLPMVAL